MVSYAGDFGTSNPESVLIRDGIVYFVDVERRAIVKLSSNGLEVISNKDISSTVERNIGFWELQSGKTIISGYDPEDNIYYVTLSPGGIFDGYTLGYDEKGGFWQGNYTFYPDRYASLKDRFFGLKQGNETIIHEFKDDNISNRFFDSTASPSPSKIKVVSNVNPSRVKVYNALSLESNSPWGISVIEDTNIKILSISEGTDERNRLYIQLNTGEKFIPLIDELIGAYNFIDSKDGILWFYTTEGAPNGKIVNLEIKNGSFVWNDVIQESKNSIRSVNVINNSFVINYLVDTFSSIKIFDLSGNFVQDLELPKNGTIGGFGGDIDDTETYFSISNYVTPREIYEINLDTLDVNLFWKEEIDGYESEDYVSELKFYPSKDGTKIPIHISYKKGLEINQDTPLMLYGYGGFNISLLPGFRKTHAAWKNLGGVYAVANLRGGGEYGSEWHEAGMLLNKQNVFDDFAFAAKFLHENNIGSEKTTAIIGGSNGGLLVAATMLQNPDLFKVAIPQVGVLDMLRFSKFTIGWAWESDYGSVDKKDEFENLLAYSPLHNIEKDKCYPTTLVTTASRDDRVVPSHSYKFAAKLQEYQGCENTILIRIEDRAGHGAGTPKDKIINQISEIYGFALKEISN